MAKDEKRQPLMADLIQRYKGTQVRLVDRAVQERVAARVLAAKRFVLADSAIENYAKVARDLPDLVLRECQFARAPYDVCWFEFNYRMYWEKINKGLAEQDGATRMGFLVDHGTGYVYTDSPQMNFDPFLSPFAYDLHLPWDDEEQVSFARFLDVPHMGIDQFMWGQAWNFLPAEQQKALRANHSIRLLPLRADFRKTSERTRDAYRHLLDEVRGEFRDLIILLLLMNRPGLTHYVRDVNSTRGFVKGKILPYMSHTVVNIPLDPIPTMRKIGTAEGDSVPKRRHEVRGHYCHDETYRRGSRLGCIHEMIPDPKHVDDGDRWHFINDAGDIERDNWVCKRCEGKRWWREDHYRGDAALGFVEKIYSVT